MNMKKGLLLFFGSWGVLLILTSLTEETSLSPWGNVLATGVIAALIFALYAVATRGDRKGRTCTVKSVSDPAVVYRVEGIWIYRGTSEKADWYLKKDGVYDFQSMKPVYRLKGGQILSGDGERLVWTVEENKVISAATGSAEYEISKT